MEFHKFPLEPAAALNYPPAWTAYPDADRVLDDSVGYRQGWANVPTTKETHRFSQLPDTYAPRHLHPPEWPGCGIP